MNKYSASGAFLTQIGSAGTGLGAAGDIADPRGLALDKSGNVYVVNSAYQRIEVFSPSP